MSSTNTAAQRVSDESSLVGCFRAGELPVAWRNSGPWTVEEVQAATADWSDRQWFDCTENILDAKRDGFHVGDAWCRVAATKVKKDKKKRKYTRVA